MPRKHAAPAALLLRPIVFLMLARWAKGEDLRACGAWVPPPGSADPDAAALRSRWPAGDLCVLAGSSREVWSALNNETVDEVWVTDAVKLLEAATPVLRSRCACAVIVVGMHVAQTLALCLGAAQLSSYHWCCCTANRRHPGEALLLLAVLTIHLRAAPVLAPRGRPLHPAPHSALPAW